MYVRTRHRGQDLRDTHEEELRHLEEDAHRGGLRHLFCVVGGDLVVRVTGLLLVVGVINRPMGWTTGTKAIHTNTPGITYQRHIVTGDRRQRQRPIGEGRPNLPTIGRGRVPRRRRRRTPLLLLVARVPLLVLEGVVVVEGAAGRDVLAEVGDCGGVGRVGGVGHCVWWWGDDSVRACVCKQKETRGWGI